ncbi:MAG: hypothetical protein Q9167_003291 [Letrouitia subvulpina]
MSTPQQPRGFRNPRGHGRARVSSSSRGRRSGTRYTDGENLIAGPGTNSHTTVPRLGATQDSARSTSTISRRFTAPRGQHRNARATMQSSAPMESGENSLQDAANQDPVAYKQNIEEVFHKLRKKRDEERHHAIREGLLADPDKPTTLANAITIVGTCKDMCPEFERVERILQQMVDECEKVSHPPQPDIRVPFHRRMVKRYRRPAAGNEEQLPSDIRPPLILKKTLDYLMKEVVGGLEPLEKVHKFVWDRTRAIRNDFSIQQVTKTEDLRLAINCFERIARFHILSLHQLSEMPNFDNYQESEQLRNTLLSLMYYYDDSRRKFTSLNEAEFRAYCIILELEDQRPDLEDRAQNWALGILKDRRVQTALKLYATACSIAEKRGPLPPLTALSLAQTNAARFFSLVQSSNVPYLMACVAEVYFNQIRRTALETLWKAYKGKRGGNVKTEDWVLDDLKNVLGFDDEVEAQEFCRQHGFTVSERENGEAYIDLGSVAGAYLTDSLSNRKQKFSKRIVEQKKHGRTLPAVIDGLSVSQAQTQGLIEDASDRTEPTVSDEESLFIPIGTNGQQPHENSAAGDPASKGSTWSFSPHTKILEPGQLSGRSPISLRSNHSVEEASDRPDVSSPLTKQIETPLPTSVASSTSLKPSHSDNQQKVPSSGTSVDWSKSVTANSMISSGAESSSSKDIFNDYRHGYPQGSMTTTSTPSLSFNRNELTANSGEEVKGLDQSNQKTPSLPQIEKEVTSFGQQDASNIHLIPKSGTPKSNLLPNYHSTEVKNMPSKSALQSHLVSFPLEGPASPSPAPTQMQISSGLFQSAPQSSIANPSPLFSLSSTPTAHSSSSSSQSYNVEISPKSRTTKSFDNERSQPAASNHETPRAPQGLSEQDRRPAVLDALADVLMTEEEGLLNQFIEFTLGPIVEKAFSEVKNERSWAKAKNIRAILLGKKYLKRWKDISWKKGLSRKAKERRKTFAKSLHELAHISRQQQAHKNASYQSSLMGRYVHSLPVTEKRPTFSPEASSQRTSLADFNLDHPQTSKSTKSKRKRQETSEEWESSSVRPLKLSHKSSSYKADPLLQFRSQGNSNLLKEMRTDVPLLRKTSHTSGQVPEHARRLVGQAKRDTTRGDYFALKARGIDPDVSLVPKPKREPRSIDNQIEAMKKLAKHPPDTAKACSKQLASGSNHSASSNYRQPISSLGSRHAQAKSNDDGDDPAQAMIAQLRSIREALAESTHWFQVEREKSELSSRYTSPSPLQKPANAEPRAWKPSPTRAQIRLEKTKGNGLLPDDWSWDKSVAEYKNRARRRLNASATLDPGRSLQRAQQPFSQKRKAPVDVLDRSEEWVGGMVHTNGHQEDSLDEEEEVQEEDGEAGDFDDKSGEYYDEDEDMSDENWDETGERAFEDGGEEEEDEDEGEEGRAPAGSALQTKGSTVEDAIEL